jgi:hypothetical protein
VSEYGNLGWRHWEHVVGLIKAAGFRRFVHGVHHALECFKGFIRFTCGKECLAPFLVCSKIHKFKIPAEELDKARSHEKHIRIILTHRGQVLVYQMNVFRWENGGADSDSEVINGLVMTPAVGGIDSELNA